MDNATMTSGEQGNSAMVDRTSAIAAAFVSNPSNQIKPAEVSELITNIFGALTTLGVQQQEAPKQEPAVSIRSSVKPDFIVCLEDGKKLKMLKRYLMTNYNMTPDEYRQKWGLNADYPMVAPNYAERRRDLAKSIGLGHSRKRKTEAAAAEAASTAKRGRRSTTASSNDSAPARRGRKKSAAA